MGEQFVDKIIWDYGDRTAQTVTKTLSCHGGGRINTILIEVTPDGQGGWIVTPPASIELKTERGETYFNGSFSRWTATGAEGSSAPGILATLSSGRVLAWNATSGYSTVWFEPGGETTYGDRVQLFSRDSLDLWYEDAGAKALFYARCYVRRGSGSVSGEGCTIAGRSYTVTATPAEGYYFDHWEIEASPDYGHTYDGPTTSTQAAYTFTQPDHAYLRFYAVFVYGTPPTPATCTVTTVAAPAAGGTTTGDGTYESGASCTIAATANEGYEFAKWTSSDGQTVDAATHTFTVSGDVTWTAHFKKQDEEGSGKLLCGRSGALIFGKSGTLLYGDKKMT